MGPPHETPRDLYVLHTLRCTGMSSLERLAAIVGLPEPEVESELIDLGVAGLTAFQPGPFAGWRVTDVGKDVDRRRITAELDATGAESVVRAGYDVFCELNTPMLELFTARQLHAAESGSDAPDPIAEARTLHRADQLDARFRPAGTQLAGVLKRFARYTQRFDRSLALVHAGSFEYLADTMDSYHAVWFQLHEDLLTTLGLQRDQD